MILIPFRRAHIRRNKSGKVSFVRSTLTRRPRKNPYKPRKR